MTFGICLLVFVIAMGVEDLGIILELNGIINANLIAFIIPGACGAMLLDGQTWYKGERVWASLLLGFGIAVSCSAHAREREESYVCFMRGGGGTLVQY